DGWQNPGVRRRSRRDSRSHYRRTVARPCARSWRTSPLTVAEPRRMESLLQASDISTVIQLAVAPVFLLASIAGTLNVLAHRLSRIIDRGRVLNERNHEPGTA